MSFDMSSLFRRSVVDILRALSQGKKRFGDLQKVSSPATVYQKVRELEEIGMIRRTAYIHLREKPIVYYELTDSGKEFLKIYSSVQVSLAQILQRKITS